VHCQATEAQILVSADWVADVSVGCVAFFVSETVNRHHKELHAVLEININMGSCGSDMKFPFSKRFSSSFVGG
jgi:hypothetical protein